MAQSKYKPIQRIGIGGMAEVLLASQRGPGGFEKLVVLKHILPHLREDAEFTQMFLDEARLAVSLHHPNIVQIFDIYRDEQEFFVAMEYISGEDLRYLCGKVRKGELKIPLPIACRMLADLAEGLEYAHGAVDVEGQPLNIVHRDVAPGNAIVSYSGATKLLDFGIAKATISHVYTRPGMLKGRLAYMAPEQVRQEAVDHRSDVFSLGVLAWELLTGRRLFRGANQAAVIQAVMERDPTPPSQINPDVPPDLDKLVLQALQKDRDRRLGSASELRDGLEAVIRKTGDIASHRDVGRWMCEALGARHQQRQETERAVTLEARQTPSRSTAGRDTLPLMFGGLTRRDDAQPSAAVLSTPTEVDEDSIPADNSFVGSYRAAKSYPQSSLPTQTGHGAARGWLYTVLGAVAMALILGAVGIAFWVGRTGVQGSVPSRAMASSRSAPVARAAPSTAVASLIVHVTPPGAILSVDGRAHPQPMGPEGTVVSARPDTDIRLSAAKPGYAGYETTVRSPQAGDTTHVHFNLRHVGVATTRPSTNASLSQPSVPEQPTAPRTTETAAPPVPEKAQKHHTAVRPRPRPSPQSPSQPTRSPRSSPQSAPVLVVAYSPADARLEIDGVHVRAQSPARVEDLSAGNHTVVVRARGYRATERTITLQGGQKLVMTLDLEPNVGTIDIITAPSGAAISVNGKPRGVSPLMGLSLPVGDVHTIEATLDGYRSWRTRTTLSSGRNPPVVASLVQESGSASATAASPSIRDITLARDTMGSAAAGGPLFRTKCNSCHGTTASAISGQHYTRAQWARYFASQRHVRHVPFSSKMSKENLADVKSYLMSRAADVARAVAAGVR